MSWINSVYQHKSSQQLIIAIKYHHHPYLGVGDYLSHTQVKGSIDKNAMKLCTYVTECWYNWGFMLCHDDLMTF